MSEIISDFLFDTISYNDYHEDFYHAFVTGILKGIGYPVESNRENGLDRTDIVVKDRKNRRALVIEAKKAASPEKLEQASQEGIDQIIKMKYHEGVENGYRSVKCYSMAFYQKTCLVRKYH